MQIDLRTIAIKPLRQTFGHLARRMGADKPASRYLEGTMDLQPVENFHYRPTWDPTHEIFDATRTRIVMADWNAFKDPRQYYYGTWILARARMQEAVEADFDLAENIGLLAQYSVEGWKVVRDNILPLRHVAWGSNINNSFIGAYAYGIALSQPATYAAMDQLGIAQYVTRLGMAFNDIDALAEAKQAWLEAPLWQELRRYIEDLMVEQDWFQVLVAQNFVLEGLLFPLIYDQLSANLNAAYGPVISMLTRFQREWYAENIKWVDSVLKIAAAEKPENKDVLTQWIRSWLERATVALSPLAANAFGDEGASVLQDVTQKLKARSAKIGIAL